MTHYDKRSRLPRCVECGRQTAAASRTCRKCLDRRAGKYPINLGGLTRLLNGHGRPALPAAVQRGLDAAAFRRRER